MEVENESCPLILVEAGKTISSLSFEGGIQEVTFSLLYCQCCFTQYSLTCQRQGVHLIKDILTFERIKR